MQNMRHKKLAAMLLTLVMALSLLTVTAFAEEGNEAKIGNTEYRTLKEALEKVQENQTITLLKPVEVEEPITLKTPITLDLGEQSLTRKGGYVLDVYSDVVIQNGSINMVEAKNASAIWLNGNAKVEVAEDATISAKDSVDETRSFAIAFFQNCDGAELVVKGKVTGENGITPNGTLKTTNTIIIEDGAVIDVDGTALYLAGNADTTVGAAEITGDTGIEIRAGSLEVNGATITATGTFAEGPNGNGTTVTGAAIAVSQHTTNQEISVTVNSGSLSGEKAFYEVDLQDEENKSVGVTVGVQGGTFSGEVASQNKTGFVAGGTFTVPVDSKLIVTGKTAASLTSDGNPTYYIGDADAVAKTLAENAKDGDVITVQQGNADFTGVAAGVQVKNEGTGTVSANGVTVEPGSSTTTTYDKNEGKEFAKVEVGETDSSSHADDENKDNPSTGDSSNLAIAVAAMLISAGGAAAAFLSKQKKA